MSITVCLAICGFLIVVFWNDSVVSRAQSIGSKKYVSVNSLSIYSKDRCMLKFHWDCILMLCIECCFDAICVAMDNLRRVDLTVNS
jgi:hypothetical protein